MVKYMDKTRYNSGIPLTNVIDAMTTKHMSPHLAPVSKSGPSKMSFSFFCV